MSARACDRRARKCPVTDATHVPTAKVRKKQGKKRVGTREFSFYVPHYLRMSPRFLHPFSFGFPKYRLDTVGFSFIFSRLHVLECKVRENRNLLTTTKEKYHNPCANRNKITTLQSKSDEKHTINTLLAYNSVVRDPFCNGSPIGKSRRHLRFTFTSLCYEKMDSLFAAPAVAQRLFPSHQRTHRRTRYVASGAHRHAPRAHHTH